MHDNDGQTEEQHLRILTPGCSICCGVVASDCARVAAGCLCDIYIIKTRVPTWLDLTRLPVSRVAASGCSPFWRSTKASPTPRKVWPTSMIIFMTPLGPQTMRKVEKYEKGRAKREERVPPFAFVFHCVCSYELSLLSPPLSHSLCFIYFIDRLGLRTAPISLFGAGTILELCAQLCAKLSFLFFGMWKLINVPKANRVQVVF